MTSFGTIKPVHGYLTSVGTGTTHDTCISNYRNTNKAYQTLIATGTGTTHDAETRSSFQYLLVSPIACSVSFTEASPVLDFVIPDAPYAFSYEEYPVPGALTGGPIGIVTGPDGNMWATDVDYAGNYILKITPAGVITKYAVTREPSSICSGPDGNLWFTSEFKIGKITTAGTVTEYNLPGWDTVDAEANYICSGPDGNLWVTTSSSGSNYGISKVTISGVFTTYTASGLAGAICSGPDGKLWFCGNSAGAVPSVGKVTTSGVFTYYTIPTSGYSGQAICSGPDGNLWITESKSGSVPLISKITTSGSFTNYVTAAPTSQILYGICEGPDGNLWSCGTGQTRGILKVTTSGTITYYGAPGSCDPNLGRITTGSDSNIWFTSPTWGRVGKLKFSSPFPKRYNTLPTDLWSLANICLGPDNNLWSVGNPDVAGYPAYIQKTLPTGETIPYPLYSNTINAWPFGIVSASSYLWITDNDRNKIVRSSTAGVMTDYTVPSSGANLLGICASGDYVWFAERNTHKIGQLKVDGSGTFQEYTYSGTDPIRPINCVAASGFVWFTDALGRIGKLNLSSTDITMFTSPTAGVSTVGCTAASGFVWYTTDFPSYIGKMDVNGNFTQYSIPTSFCNPTDICVGPDNNFWFTEYSSSPPKIGKMDINGNFTEYSIPQDQIAGNYGFNQPIRITSGPDGNLWILSSFDDKIAKCTTSGSFTVYATSEQSAGDRGLCVGPDSNLWFTMGYLPRIVKCTTSGTQTSYNVGTVSTPNVRDICTGPDDNIWFTTSNFLSTSTVSNITTSGTFTSYSATGDPNGICEGPDGNSWYADPTYKKIGKITTSGVITEYGPLSKSPYDICQGTDGNLWFSGNRIVGKITTGGSVTEYPTSDTQTYTTICQGTDGNLWTSDSGSNVVMKVTTGGTLTKYTLPLISGPLNVVSTSDRKILFTEQTGNNDGQLGRITTDGQFTEYSALLQVFGNIYGTCIGADSNLWFTDSTYNTIGTMTLQLDPTVTFDEATPAMDALSAEDTTPFIYVSESSPLYDAAVTNPNVLSEFLPMYDSITLVTTVIITDTKIAIFKGSNTLKPRHTDLSAVGTGTTHDSLRSNYRNSSKAFTSLKTVGVGTIHGS